MTKTILHIDFNSYFATVEQQANPRLRGKPIGVTGGDRMKRTVIGAASVEAKKFGVRTGMQLWEAKKLCPDLILVPGDSDKYLSCTKKFLNILKDYSPYLEVFSIDEVFLELPCAVIPSKEGIQLNNLVVNLNEPRILTKKARFLLDPPVHGDDIVKIAQGIKKRIKSQIGEWMRVSIGISYNKLLAKLASNMQKPDGLIIIPDQETAIKILDQQPLDEICGIGFRIKKRLNQMGIFNFKQLRQVPLDSLLFEFKSYGQFLYDASRGLDDRPILPFYEKEEVKSIGHRHTISHDTDDLVEIKQIMLQLTELIARKLRVKKLVGRTISCWFRYKLEYPTVTLNKPVTLSEAKGISNGLYPSVGSLPQDDSYVKPHFTGGGMQSTIIDTDDGLDIFNAAWRIFHQIWDPSASSGQVRPIRMVGVSISNLKPITPQNLSFLEDIKRREVITKALDKINDKYGEFTLQRGILLNKRKFRRMPNSFLADRRFKVT